MSTPDNHDILAHPELTGARVRLRPGDERDVLVLCAILAEPEVACWWGPGADQRGGGRAARGR